MNHGGLIYILCNERRTVLYVGVTSDLRKRIFEHKRKVVAGFTQRYNVDQLLYWEQFDDIEKAIFREKQIKSYSRIKKLNLVKITNPQFNDLSDAVLS